MLTIRGRLITPFVLGSMSVGLNILIRHSFMDLWFWITALVPWPQVLEELNSIYILKLKHSLFLLQLHRKLSNLIHLFDKTQMMTFGEHVIEKTRVPRENHQPWLGEHYRILCLHWESNLSYSSDQRETYPCAIQASTLRYLGPNSWLSTLISAWLFSVAII